jgi:ABC-2 type transport system ATP-binding protein
MRSSVMPDKSKSQYAIQVENLSKRFPRTAGYRDILTFWRRKHVRALDGVSLAVQSGGIFGVLGPNGAGKTTLLKILVGLILPDEGRVLIKGVDASERPGQTQKSLTYVSGDERTLYWRLTGRQNLLFFAALNEIPRRDRAQRVEDVLDIVGLSDVANERVMGYSTGMRQRLALARGILPGPEIILLDEPTRSLDPLSARSFQDFIKHDLAGRHGKTIVLTTHNMEEASYLCERVAILHQGRLKACDTVDAITQKLAGRRRFTVTLAEPLGGVASQLRNLPGVMAVTEDPANGHGYDGLSLEVTVEDPAQHMPLIVECIVRSGGKVVQVSQAQASLTDAIAALTEEPVDNHQAARVPVERLGAGA